MSGDELNQDQKTDLEQILQDRMNALLSLKNKERLVQEVSAAKLAEEQKLKDAAKADVKEEKIQKLSEMIKHEATSVVQLYFDNGEYITQVKAQFPEEIQVI